MERSIDGIDYIAKSELLAAVDDNIRLGDRMGREADPNSEQLYTWSGYVAAMLRVKRYITEGLER